MAPSQMFDGLIECPNDVCQKRFKSSRIMLIHVHTKNTACYLWWCNTFGGDSSSSDSSEDEEDEEAGSLPNDNCSSASSCSSDVDAVEAVEDDDKEEEPGWDGDDEGEEQEDDGFGVRVEAGWDDDGGMDDMDVDVGGEDNQFRGFTSF